MKNISDFAELLKNHQYSFLKISTNKLKYEVLHSLEPKLNNMLSMQI